MHRAGERGRHMYRRDPRHDNDVWIWMRLLLKHLDFLQLYTAALKQIMSERIAD